MKPRPGQGSQLAGALESAGSGLRGETSVGSTGLDQARLDQEHELQRVEAALKRLDHGRFRRWCRHDARCAATVPARAQPGPAV